MQLLTLLRFFAIADFDLWVFESSLDWDFDVLALVVAKTNGCACHECSFSLVISFVFDDFRLLVEGSDSGV